LTALLHRVWFCLLLLAAPLAARAEPALWRLGDADSTIYLFGTIHLLHPDMTWQSPKIAAAFAEAEELWLEADVSALATFGPVMRYGVSYGLPLSKALTPDDLTRVLRILEPQGVPLGTINHLRPWLVAIMIATIPSQKAGFVMEEGADMVLQREATGRQLPIRRLESVSDQLKPFASLTPDQEIAVLLDALDAYEHPEGDNTAELANAWLKGDEATLGALLAADSQIGEQGPLYDGLIVQRNAAWVKKIEERLAGSGISFIAVGAGHLVGPDSVIAMLAARGLKAERQ